MLLITPPFTQLNTPYPATAYLKGFLNSKNILARQIDLGMEVTLRLFSKEGLETMFLRIKQTDALSENARRIYVLRHTYIQTINEVILFLQGKNPTLAWQLVGEGFLPQAARFDTIDDLEWAFGTMGIQDKAKHLATLYLEDISDFMVECIDPEFGFSRYAERLGRSANSFDELYDQLQKEAGYIDSLTFNALMEAIQSAKPRMICFSVPFPGNLFSAFRCAQYIKKEYPTIKITMGGGFPTTELRSLKDPRVFEFFDYIVLDSGELPLELLHTHQESQLPFEELLLKRTFGLSKGEVYYNNTAPENDYSPQKKGSPDYTGLPLDKYISVIEMANPMHSLWSNGRWNKLTLAHGCYWGKCTFCDGSLSYIKDFAPSLPKDIVDSIETLIEQTGERGFHFVDEAAPPALLKALALELIRRKVNISWWTNIRFEIKFTPDLCHLLKAAGCIAVSGGLEVASDRLLKLINKGVSVAQVAQVTSSFTEAGIMVHAYLMYGFPTQTEQETVDSLEMVRQMFELGIVQSAFWHRFALTAHSPVGMNPDRYNIVPHYKEISFANNDIQFTDKTGVEHEKFSFGLKKSLYNFMHGVGFDIPVHEWFNAERVKGKIAKTSIQPNFIQKALFDHEAFQTKPDATIFWLGGIPVSQHIVKTKKGRKREFLQITVYDKVKAVQITVDADQGIWLLALLERLSVFSASTLTFRQVKTDYEEKFNDFELFWYSKPVFKLRECGLLVL